MTTTPATPTAVPVITVFRPIPWNFVMFLCFAGYVAYEHFIRPKPEAYAPPLVQAAKTHMATLADPFKAAEQGVRFGSLKTDADIAKAFALHSKPLADELARTVKAASNDKGEVTNPQGLADTFHQVYVALGGK